MNTDNGNMTINELPELLTVKEISQYLRVCYTKALNIVKFSGIDYLKIDNSYRVRKEVFESWINIHGQRNYSVCK